MLVSVIIPTYNRASLVADAVRSVLVQDYKPVELIVVDDGSTDHTVQTLVEFGESIKVIRQPNKGVSAARNAGISAAAGELIALLDSDDRWLAGKLSAQTEFFRQHPQALICQTEEIWIRRGKRVNPKLRHQKPSGFIFEASLQLCLVSPSAVMMRKQLFDLAGLFDENLPACEDYDLWLRVSAEYPIFLIDRPFIIKHGGHDDQLSKQPGLDRYRIKSLIKLLNSGRLNQRQISALISVLKQKCRIYADGCQKRGRLDEALTYYQLAETYSQLSSNEH